MKKFFMLLLSAFMLTACRREVPASYDFYNEFSIGVSDIVEKVDTTGYKDSTVRENLSLMRDELGLENLASFQLMEKKGVVIASFIFSSEADHKQLETASKYAVETFWQGKVHTAGMLPYEDWQYSHLTKQLTVQIFCHDQLAIQDIYIFDKLTDSGDKLYSSTHSLNEDVLFTGTYIYLGDLLKGTSEQLDAYVNIDDIAGITVHTALRENLTKDTLYVELLTEEKQINPQNLNNIYDAVYERYSFINDNISIRLYVADKGMYYEYSSHIVPPEEK